ncbi:Rec8 like protein-domain-containing protein [Phycomyces nitens]|nr:Rec8 like protein-domain-containing protein [Phycomyces nitens]
MSVLPDQIITKQGPLARVWLASHWERKLSKSQFLQTNLEKTIDAISVTQQQEPYALRVSGQLLLGVVRIYSRKTRYLLEDCNEALVKIKLAFKKGNVNMPDINQSVANLGSITLPERLTEFDILLPSVSFNALYANPADSRDAVLDSLEGVSLSQDITLTDAQDGLMSGSWGFDMIEQRRRDMLGDTERPFDFSNNTFFDIETGRRDAVQTGEFSDFFGMQDIEGPMNKMGLEDNAKAALDNNDSVDFDFDLGDDEMNNRPQANNEFAFDLQNDLLNRQRETSEMTDAPFLEALTQTGVPAAQEPARRRRRLVVDKVTEIPHDELKQYMQDTSSIIDKSADGQQYKEFKSAEKVDLLRPSALTSVSGLDGLFASLSRKRRASQMITDNQDANQDNVNQDDTGFDNYEFETPGMDDVYESRPQDFGFEGSQDSYRVNTQSAISTHAQMTLEKIEKSVVGNRPVAFRELEPTTKSDAARMFYDILLLSTKNKIQVKQTAAFGDIQIRPHATVF